MAKIHFYIPAAFYWIEQILLSVFPEFSSARNRVVGFRVPLPTVCNSLSIAQFF